MLYPVGLPSARRLARYVEPRHPSWNDPAVYALLESRRAAYVVTSSAELPCIPRATTDFVYVRMHGPDPDAMYAGSYPIDDLRRWVEMIAEWDSPGRDVWMYFDTMASSTTFVIAGGGLAGAKAAEALRDKEFDGQVILVGEEERLQSRAGEITTADGNAAGLHRRRSRRVVASCGR